MHRLFIALTLSLCLVCAGCVVIPIPINRTPPEERFAGIDVRSTTKSEVQQRLGAPNIFRIERTFVYEVRTAGTLLIFVALWDGTTAEAGIKHATLLVRFDENDVVSETQVYEARLPRGFEGPGEAVDAPFQGRSLRLLEYLPDGVIAAAEHRGGCVYIWDLASQHVLGQYSLDDPPELLAIAPTGAALAAVGPEGLGGVNLWDAATGKRTIILGQQDGAVPIWAIAFSSDGEMLAVASADGTVSIWQTATGAPLLRLAAHKPMPPNLFDGGAKSVVFSPNNRWLATAGFRKEPPADPIGPWNPIKAGGAIVVKLWDVATGDELATLETHRWGGSDIGMAFSGDGSLLAFNCGAHVEIWRISPSTGPHEPEASRLNSELPYPLLDIAAVIPHELSRVRGQGDPGSLGGAVSLSRDGRFLAAVHGPETTLHNLTTGEGWVVRRSGLVTRFPRRWGSVSFSPDGKTLLTGDWPLMLGSLQARLFRVSEARARE